MENNRASLLCYAKLWASFRSHQWIRTGETVRKIQILYSGKKCRFLSRVTLKFDGWPWKTTGRIFYATSSFYHNLIAIMELKLELQSGNAQFGSKLAIFVPSDLEILWMTLKTIGHLFYATSSFVHHFVAIDEFKLELQSEKAQFGWKSAILCRVWPCNLTNDFEKQ